MREYGVVFHSFWTKPELRDLNDFEKLLALYLLTGPHTTAIGVFRIPKSYIVEDLRGSLQTVTKGLKNLSETLFLGYCSHSSMVFLPSFLKYNPPQNPNQRKNLLKLYEAIPKNFSYFKELQVILGRFDCPVNIPENKPFQNPLQTLSKPGPGPGPGPGPEVTALSGKPDAGAGGNSSALYAEVFEHWQKTMDHPKANFDPKRKALIKTALGWKYSVQDLKDAITGCSNTPHNVGMNKQGTRYDGLNVILKDASQIDRFMANFQNPPRPMSEADHRTHTNKLAGQEFIDDVLRGEK